MIFILNKLQFISNILAVIMNLLIDYLLKKQVIYFKHNLRQF